MASSVGVKVSGRCRVSVHVSYPPGEVDPKVRSSSSAVMCTSRVAVLSRTDSGTGVELNLSGYAALKLGWVEGVELNLLGLVAGLDLRHPGLKLPGFGRIGVESPVATALAR